MNKGLLKSSIFFFVILYIVSVIRIYIFDGYLNIWNVKQLIVTAISAILFYVVLSIYLKIRDKKK